MNAGNLKSSLEWPYTVALVLKWRMLFVQWARSKKRDHLHVVLHFSGLIWTI